MKISEIQRVSMNDFPKKCASVIFTSSCNYRCPTCHAKKILDNKKNISEDEVFGYLDSKKGWIDGVVICGGEPTRELGLVHFLEKINERGLKIKLDTNGSDPGLLMELNKQGLVDYVAMDVKGPRSLYAKLVGKDFIDIRDCVEKGIGIVSQFPDYEFRTTVVPIFEDGKMRWMTPEEIGKTAKMIAHITGEQPKYFLQKFVARSKYEMLDEKFGKENLPEEFLKTPDELLEECYWAAQEYLFYTKTRR